MELSNGVTMIQVATANQLTGLLIKSEISDRAIVITGHPSRMADLVNVITKRLKQGFTFDVLKGYAEHLMKQENQGA